MKRLHKNEKDVLLSKSKEGKRTFLCSNKMSNRLPSFDFIPNLHFESEIAPQDSPDEQQIKLREAQKKLADILINCWLSEKNRNELY